MTLARSDHQVVAVLGEGIRGVLHCPEQSDQRFFGEVPRPAKPGEVRMSSLRIEDGSFYYIRAKFALLVFSWGSAPLIGVMMMS